MRHTLPALAALACALTACQPQPLSQADEEAVRAVGAAFGAAVNASNVDGMTAIYASDATVQPPGMPGATGTAAIHKLWTDMTAPMKATLSVTVTKVAGQGDVAYTTGTYHIVFAMKDATQASPPPEDGKYVNVLWRQADKSWKVVADTWNANSMPAAPAAAPARSARH